MAEIALPNAPVTITTPKPCLLPSTMSLSQLTPASDSRSMSPASNSGAEGNGSLSPLTTDGATRLAAHPNVWNTSSIPQGAAILLHSYPCPTTTSNNLFVKGPSEVDAASALTTLSQTAALHSQVIASQPLGKGGAVRQELASSPATGNVAYAIKRKRNNEAVRRCRMKKKEENAHRASRLAELEQQVKELEARNRKLSDIVTEQHAELAKYRSQQATQPSVVSS
eukprot:m.26808 g.26808  ORF g.26808 m.26808 type:complete len:225 (+) comp11716_c0_seq1:1153-1827(+)